MSQFANHLLSRHLEPEKSLQPRLRGRFEPVSLAPALFTGEHHREAPAVDSFRQPAANELVQPLAPDREKPFYPEPHSKQTTAPDQATTRTNPFPPHDSSLAEKRTYGRDITEGAAADYSLLPGLQPAVAVPAPDEKKGQSPTPENPFVKNNQDNQTAVPFTGKGFADRQIAATQSDFSAETVQPAQKKNNMAFSESSPDGVTETLLFQPSSRYVNLPPVHHPGETNQPVVKVTIGRIEVRAVVQAVSTPARSAGVAKPKLSLEDYLKQRNNKTA